MKELNKFRKFLTEGKEETNEGIGDGGLADKMIKFSMGVFKLPGMNHVLYSMATDPKAREFLAMSDEDIKLMFDEFDIKLPKNAFNDQKEGLDENDKALDEIINEGTWSVGSPQSRDKLAQMLTDIQMKNDSVEDMLQSFEVAKKYAYAVAGSDDVFDYLDAAEAELEKGEEGFDPDHFSDHITDAILAITKLQENDKALDEVIEEGTIFDEIDEMIETLAVHMSAEDVLKELMHELQIVGGTKALHASLKNIMIDADLMEVKNEEE